MRKQLLYTALLLFFLNGLLRAQDTIAIQDFENSPATPTWTYTGTPAFQSGLSPANATPANSPLGINGSQAWHTVQVSSGVTLDFANIAVPSGYDSTTVFFKIAAMNLNGSSGGPDHLDYILVELSTDGGTTFYDRLRIRGAVANNCSWAYSASAVAEVSYLPATEAMFQPANSGLQTTDGYATAKINFPSSVSQIKVKITARSSSSSDSWLIDNVMLLGHTNCPTVTSTVNTSICRGQRYFAGGKPQITTGTYIDTLRSSQGCDSIVTTNLTVDTVGNKVSQNWLTFTSNVSGVNYQWVDCNNGYSPLAGETSQSFTVTTNGSYALITSDGSCNDTSACFVVNNVGLAENMLQNIKVYPVPAGNKLYLNLPEEMENTEITISGMNGAQILNQTIVEAGEHTLELDEIANGVYVLKLQHGPDVRILKLPVCH